MPTPAPVADLQALTEAGQQGLAHLIETEKLGSHRPRAEVRIGSPAAEIVAAASDLHADLICIGTHGRGGLARVILGSVAELIVRQAPCPVLTVRPKASGQITCETREAACGFLRLAFSFVRRFLPRRVYEPLASRSNRRSTARSGSTSTNILPFRVSVTSSEPRSTARIVAAATCSLVMPP